MRVYLLSDVHVDYAGNMAWLAGLSNADYRDDMLLLAGDLSDLPRLLERALHLLVRKFSRVFFVPGNHELWVRRCKTADSIAKFDKVLAIAEDSGASTRSWQSDRLRIVPLFAWYDYSFGPPGDLLTASWTDFHACAWPRGENPASITERFLAMNPQCDPDSSRFVISFSHFLPRIDVMPDHIPVRQRYLYPVLGSRRLGLQVNRLRPNVHAYGHSHVNQRCRIDGVEYVNNAYGYPSETGISRKALISVYADDASPDSDAPPESESAR